jgi:hypothetical protein
VGQLVGGHHAHFVLQTAFRTEHLVEENSNEPTPKATDLPVYPAAHPHVEGGQRVVNQVHVRVGVHGTR